MKTSISVHDLQAAASDYEAFCDLIEKMGREQPRTLSGAVAVLLHMLCLLEQKAAFSLLDKIPLIPCDEGDIPPKQNAVALLQLAMGSAAKGIIAEAPEGPLKEAAKEFWKKNFSSRSGYVVWTEML